MMCGCGSYYLLSSRGFRFLTHAVFFVLSIYGIGAGIVSAQLNNANNPLIDEKHAGGAHRIAVVGLADASNEDGGQEDAFINVVKNAVNWILGILALIALLILLRGGFQMVTSAGDDDKYNKGFTILKHAAAGLILIGVAWFIISLIFWLVNLISSDAGPANSDQ